MTQIITDVGPGLHNANLGLATARIVEGGTWKKQRTVMLMPAAKMVPAKCALSWMNLIIPPNQGFMRWLLLGDEVGVAYSNAIEQVLANPVLKDWEYVLFLEHDNTPPPDGLLKLLRHLEQHPELAAVSGLYFTKGEGGVPQIWGDINDPVPNYRPQPPVPGQLVECYGIGQGFSLFRLSMFNDPKLRKPWFKTRASVDEGVGTQDLYFWEDAKKFGYRCGVACDVLVGHYDPDRDINW